MKITVLMGGTSSERDVSLASGVRIAQALRGRGHDVISLDTARGVIESEEEEAMLRGVVVKTAPPELEQLQHMARTSLSPSLGMLPAIREVDVVFLALHGGQGEDGTLQALLDLAGVRYTGSGHLGSALAMDKDLSKHLFRAYGVDTADWVMVTRGEEIVEGERRFEASGMGLPVVVKPSKQGSTVGLSVVRERNALSDAIREALRFDDEVMIEQFVPGRELTVSVLGSRALPVGEIFPKHEIYDYECKYTQGMAVEEFPARLSSSETGEIQRQALAAFRALKLGGYARVDFRMSGDGRFYCLEANTLPGMTGTSLLPQAAAADGMPFAELCERIAQLALERDQGGVT
ncbi:MAG TPA: D-alanine--D-alanine ligase [Gemmatimonadaceae bacterium]|jgi:D-alanine-D-alanine ligase|nr:D-alanine--D-alanine ligase [Gemmatimonadaceae bacterium]